MSWNLSKTISPAVVAAGFIGGAALLTADSAVPAAINCGSAFRAAHGAPRGSRLFVRTELFFGKAKPDGSMVSDGEFRRFVDQEVTPRFPGGLTLVPGSGQYRGSGGAIQREDAILLILLYPEDNGRSALRIEEIRERYKRWFRQESVLRLDGETCVSF